MTTDKSSVRSLTKQERDMVCEALTLQRKSFERAANAAKNPTVAELYTKDAAMCENLRAHIFNQSLEV